MLVFLPHCLRAQGVVRDDFEGPEPVLRPAGGDGRHRVELHQRVDVGAHAGRRCEQLRITGGGATAIYYSYPIRPARVINELAMGVWLRSDRPGLQIVARVVLPRSKHPATGEPLTTLLRGSDYKQVGSWQLVTIGNLPRALEWQVRVLRAQFGPQVDGREAYVDLLLLNVYGGAGTTNVWVDDLEITGAIPPTAVAAQEVTFASGAAPAATSGSEPSVPQSSMPTVEFKHRLLVGGEPFFPRIVVWRGEPLERLQRLGFNCVRVAQLPTAAMLADAVRLKLWLLAPPPPPAALKPRQGERRARPIPAAFDPVLAWDLGDQLTERELDTTRRWAEAVQDADPRGRPIVCGATSDLDDYTHPPFQVLLSDRDPLGTSLELDRYIDWLGERSQLARAGAPLWVRVSSQASPELVEQMRLVAGGPVPPPNWQEAQLRMVVHAALASQARGLMFASDSRLDLDDPATATCAAMLELVNLELQLIDRWPAAGNFAAMADTSESHTTGAVIETDHSRLLLPIYAPPGGQFALGTQAVANVSFVVAGVPEGDKAYELSLTGLHPLRATRAVGGTKVVLTDRSRDSLVVFTSDPYVVRNLKAGLDKIQRRADFLARQLAIAETARVDATTARLGPYASGVSLVQEARAAVALDLHESETLAATDIPRLSRGPPRPASLATGGARVLGASHQRLGRAAGRSADGQLCHPAGALPVCPAVGRRGAF